MPDPEPKLRVIDEAPEEPSTVVRLGAKGVSVVPVERLPGLKAKETPERLESEVHENFDGRSLEPGVEAILDQQAQVENIEQPWGVGDGRLVGVPYGWFVLIILALVGAGVWSLLAMRHGEMKLEIDHGAVREKVAKEEDATRAATALVDRVEEVVAAYLRAETIDEILPWVRHPERVRPMIEEAWKSEPKRRLKFERMNLFQPASMADRPFWVVRAEVEEGEMQNLLIEQTGEAEVKVDWETHVCRQPMPWETYVAERPEEGALDFRVWAVPDQFFSHEFSDGRKWKCFRLTAKGAEEHLFGYALADSDAYRELNALCQSSAGWRASVVLRLRIPEGSVSPRGVVIEKIVAPRWLILDDPGKDSP
jgi:hypothetical protein